MFPFVEIFGRNIGLFSIMVLCGVFSSGIYASSVAKKHKLNSTEIIIFMLFLSVGVIIGGTLLFAFVNIVTNKSIIQASIINIGIAGFFPILAFIFGGSIFYGGLIGGLIAAWVCTRKNNVYLNYIDIVAVSIPLFHFFGRIGCFLGGCCFGIESTFGFTFQNSIIVAANGVSRFPVQLLEALFNMSLFFLLNYCFQNGKFRNRLVYVYLLIYSTGRFFIEFLRGDEYRGIWGFFSTSQIISVMIFLFVLIVHFQSRRSVRLSNYTISSSIPSSE